MNQKGFANIVLVLIIIAIAGAVGYFIFVKKSEPTTPPLSPTSTSPTTPISNGQPTPAPQSEKTILQELALDDGSRVSLISSSPVGQSSNLNKIFNCKLPEIETVNVSLEYKGKTISLGFIGVPKNTEGHFPVIQNTINYGLEDLVKSFEWSPLQKLARSFGVIDYSSVKSVDPKSRGKIGLSACYLEYKMQFFEIDSTNRSLRLRDTGTGLDLYGDLERFKKEITPGCSPFGCG